MFIRKKKLLKEIDAMIEDNDYWYEYFEARGNDRRADAFKCTKNELKDLIYFIEHNKRWRNLYKRDGFINES